MVGWLAGLLVGWLGSCIVFMCLCACLCLCTCTVSVCLADALVVGRVLLVVFGVTDKLNAENDDNDSDDDGLFDGTEVGVTTPAKDTNVDAKHFVADAESSTHTDPVVADTDQGGVSDGSEDANANGRPSAAANCAPNSDEPSTYRGTFVPIPGVATTVGTFDSSPRNACSSRTSSANLSDDLGSRRIAMNAAWSVPGARPRPRSMRPG